MALLNTAYGFCYNAIYYSQKEISEMAIGDLHDDYTVFVLTANGESKQSPECGVEALREYLALREKLSPHTMSEKILCL